MIRIPTDHTPTHPGEMLLEEFLIPMGLTQQKLADAIRVPYQRINDLVNARRGMTPNTALRLACYFAAIAETINSASSPTPNSKLDCRLYSQGIPMKYNPEEFVIPRFWIGYPSSSTTGNLTRL